MGFSSREFSRIYYVILEYSLKAGYTEFSIFPDDILLNQNAYTQFIMQNESDKIIEDHIRDMARI